MLGPILQCISKLKIGARRPRLERQGRGPRLGTRGSWPLGSGPEAQGPKLLRPKLLRPILQLGRNSGSKLRAARARGSTVKIAPRTSQAPGLRPELGKAQGLRLLPENSSDLALFSKPDIPELQAFSSPIPQNFGFGPHSGPSQRHEARERGSGQLKA